MFPKEMVERRQEAEHGCYRPIWLALIVQHVKEDVKDATRKGRARDILLTARKSVRIQERVDRM
jgi:hypothetical protein